MRKRLREMKPATAADRPVADIVRITRMVAWKLFSRGMFLSGLYRSLSGKALIVE